MATVLAILVVGLMVLAAIYVRQDRLLYFPAPATVANVAAAELRAWPSAQDFRGLVAEPAGAVRGTAIVFHGNAGHVGDRAFYAHALAHRQYGGPLLLVGESLGAAVAAAAAVANPQRRELTAGLLLITPWDRLAQVGAHHYPWLPVKWMLRDEYDTQARLAGFDRPVLVAVAERDSIVPARFGRALHAGLAGPKRLVVIEAADHNDWTDRVDAGWWRAAVAFALGVESWE
ncbi:MAG: alpha/beta hydrolase [Burkholderiaceae bacterium]|nr:alpha/beta hydrolase [Burkholderiaceae bacterium]